MSNGVMKDKKCLQTLDTKRCKCETEDIMKAFGLSPAYRKEARADAGLVDLIDQENVHLIKEFLRNGSLLEDSLFEI